MRTQVRVFGKIDLLAGLTVWTKAAITGPTVAGVTEVRMGRNLHGNTCIPLPCVAAVTIPPDREAIIDRVAVLGNLEFLALVAVLLISPVALPAK